MKSTYGISETQSIQNRLIIIDFKSLSRTHFLFLAIVVTKDASKKNQKIMHRRHAIHEKGYLAHELWTFDAGKYKLSVGGNTPYKLIQF